MGTSQVRYYKLHTQMGSCYFHHCNYYCQSTTIHSHTFLVNEPDISSLQNDFHIFINKTLGWSLLRFDYAREADQQRIFSQRDLAISTTGDSLPKGKENDYISYVALVNIPEIYCEEVYEENTA